MPDPIIINQALVAFDNDQQQVTQIVKSLSQDQTLPLTAIPQAIEQIDQLIINLDSDACLPASDHKIWEEINKVRKAILQGHQYQLQIYQSGGLQALQSYSRNTELKNLDEARAVYALRTTPNFLTSHMMTQDNVYSYLREIVGIGTGNSSVKKPKLRLNEVTMRFWGGSFFTIESLHHAANPNINPFKALFNYGLTSKSVDFAFESAFEYGCAYDHRLIAASSRKLVDVTSAKVRITQLEHHYTDLYKQYEQVRQAYFSVETPAKLKKGYQDVVVLTYLQTLKLRMEAVSHYRDYLDFWHARGIYSRKPKSLGPTDQGIALKKEQLKNIALKVYDLPKSSYWKRYASTLTQASRRQGMNEILYQVDKLIEPGQNPQLIKELAHTRLPLNLFESIEEAVLRPVLRQESKSIGSSQLYLYSGAALLDYRNVKEFGGRTKELGQITHHVLRTTGQRLQTFYYTRQFHPGYISASADRALMALHCVRGMINGLDHAVLHSSAQLDAVLDTLPDIGLKEARDQSTWVIHKNLNNAAEILALPAKLDHYAYQKWQRFWQTDVYNVLDSTASPVVHESPKGDVQLDWLRPIDPALMSGKPTLQPITKQPVDYLIVGKN